MLWIPHLEQNGKGGVAEHQWGVGSGRGLLMRQPRLESGGEKGITMRSRCFFKSSFLWGPVIGAFGLFVRLLPVLLER